MLHYPSYYQGFTDEQFAADEYFQQWVLSADRHCDEFWQSYLNLNPKEAEIISRARQLVEELAEDNYKMLPLTAEEKGVLKRHVFQRLHLEVSMESFSIPVRRRRYGWMVAAASLAIVAVSAYFLIRPAGSATPATLAEITSGLETREITLPDSSVVILNAGSSLKYSSGFLDQPDRVVYLEGNAFFHVKKLTDHKPFIVHARSLAITVLGTQFNVNARSAAAEVGLTSGKVKITETGVSDSAFMLPGEKITLDTVQRSLVKSKLDTQLYAAWTDNKWIFRQTTLEDITGLISEYYGVSTEFKKEKNRRLKVTAVIPVTDLSMLIRILSKTLHIEITQTGNRLIIQ